MTERKSKNIDGLEKPKQIATGKRKKIPIKNSARIISP